MPLLYGFGDSSASTQAARRISSISLSQEAIWFQLAGIGDAIKVGKPAIPAMMSTSAASPSNRYVFLSGVDFDVMQARENRGDRLLSTQSDPRPSLLTGALAQACASAVVSQKRRRDIGLRPTCNDAVAAGEDRGREDSDRATSQQFVSRLHGQSDRRCDSCLRSAFAAAYTRTQQRIREACARSTLIAAPRSRQSGVAASVAL